MQKNSLHVNLADSSKLLTSKRLVWLTQSEQQKNKEAEKPKSQLAIEDFLGKKPEEAQDEIQKTLKVSDEKIGKILQQWMMKGDLNKYVTKLAKERIRQKAEALKVEESHIKKHAEGSIMVLSAKRDVLNELTGDIDREIQVKEQQLERVNQAREALSFWKKPRSLRSSDLEKGIANLRKLRNKAETLQEKNERKQDRKNEGVEQAKDLDEKMRGLILSHDEKLAGELDHVIRGEVLGKSDDQFPGGLDGFFSRHESLKKMSKAEKKTCTEILRYLKAGSTRANFSRGLLGTFSKSDVEAFYLDKYLQRGELNRDSDSVEERIDRLKKLPLGQEVTILSFSRFAVVRKPNSKFNGYILKDKFKDRIAYINIDNSKKPTFTIRDEHGNFETSELEASKNTNPSLVSVEFSKKTPIPESAPQPPAPTPAPSPSPAPTPAPSPTPTPPPTPAP